MAGDLVDLDALGPDGEYRTRTPEAHHRHRGHARRRAERRAAAVRHPVGRRAAQGSSRCRLAEREAALAEAADVFRVRRRSPDSTSTTTSSSPAGCPGCRWPWPGRAPTSSPNRWRTAFDAVVRPGRRAHSTRLARARPRTAVRCGRAAARCSPSTLPATRPACTGCGRRRWRWATGSRSGRHAASRSPPTGSIHALRQAGFRDDDALYLPTDHAVADEIIEAADLAMVYGGQDVADRYAAEPDRAGERAGPHQDPDHRRVRLARLPRRDRRLDRQPGRHGVRQRHRRAVRGRPAPLAHAIAERLSAMRRCRTPTSGPLCPPRSVDDARAIAEHLGGQGRRRRRPCSAPIRWSPTSATGTPRCAPPCTCCATPDADKLNVELPFPCVWVAPWSRAIGIAPLRNSLVLNAITERRRPDRRSRRRADA